MSLLAGLHDHFEKRMRTNALNHRSKVGFLLAAAVVHNNL